MRSDFHRCLVLAIVLAFSFGLIDFGMGLNEARSQNTPSVSGGTHSCTDALHNQLKGQNRIAWESSYLAESNLICSTARSNAAHLESAGLSKNDAELATFSAWLQLKKSGHAVTSVSTADLENVIETFGLLIVDSEPSEADVTIDANPCSTVTECRYWVPPGSHEIVISKKGYQSEKIQQTVTNGRATRVVKTLRH
jgi:PEGA domain-containing protein